MACPCAGGLIEGDLHDFRFFDDSPSTKAWLRPCPRVMAARGRAVRRPKFTDSARGLNSVKMASRVGDP